MSSGQHEFVIIGAGITGLTVARELLLRGARDVAILEKEETSGAHASGRNSGVLHAGIYYTADSLKARFCADGARQMKRFCRDRGIAVHETGKVIVASEPSQVPALDELKLRADACGARAWLVDVDELARIEPHAVTCDRALFSPGTAVVEPRAVLDALETELVSSGKVTMSFNTRVRGRYGESGLATTRGVVGYEHLINAAGSFADRIAHRFDVARDYRTLPFKGTYKRLPAERSFLVRGSVYPVPDLRNPFLGAHFTRAVNGRVYVGPTAIPALGRENYRALDGLTWEAPAIIMRDALLLVRNDTFRNAALTEPRKYLTRFLFREARRLIPELRMEDLEATDKVGIRPQLVHWPTKTLVMDFMAHVEGNVLHILNAISPAFTSSMAFARHAVDLLVDPRQGAPHALPI